MTLLIIIIIIIIIIECNPAVDVTGGSITKENPEGVSLQPIQHSLAVPSRAGRLLNIATRPPRWGWAAGCPRGDVRSGFPRLCPWLGGHPPEGGFCRHVVGLVPRARPCSCYPSVLSCPQLIIPSHCVAVSK